MQRPRSIPKPLAIIVGKSFSSVRYSQLKESSVSNEDSVVFCVNCRPGFGHDGSKTSDDAIGARGRAILSIDSAKIVGDHQTVCNGICVYACNYRVLDAATEGAVNFVWPISPSVIPDDDGSADVAMNHQFNASVACCLTPPHVVLPKSYPSRSKPVVPEQFTSGFVIDPLQLHPRGSAEVVGSFSVSVLS